VRKHPLLKAIPIIAYSVHTSEAEQARRLGFNGFLGKPLNADDFADQLHNILQGNSVWIF
jgi:two-component system, cell cycle response regulator DivK